MILMGFGVVLILMFDVGIGSFEQRVHSPLGLFSVFLEVNLFPAC